MLTYLSPPTFRFQNNSHFGEHLPQSDETSGRDLHQTLLKVGFAMNLAGFVGELDVLVTSSCIDVTPDAQTGRRLFAKLHRVSGYRIGLVRIDTAIRVAGARVLS